MENGNVALRLENSNEQHIKSYVYCGNNPVSYIDPDGRESILGPLIEQRSMQRIAQNRAKYYDYFKKQFQQIVLANRYKGEAMNRLVRDYNRLLETLESRGRIVTVGYQLGFRISGRKGNNGWYLYFDSNENSWKYKNEIAWENIKRETLWDLHKAESNNQSIEENNVIIYPKNYLTNSLTFADGTPVEFAFVEAAAIPIQGMLPVAPVELVNKETTDATAVVIQNKVSSDLEKIEFGLLLLYSYVKVKMDAVFSSKETEQPTVENAKEKAPSTPTTEQAGNTATPSGPELDPDGDNNDRTIREKRQFKKELKSFSRGEQLNQEDVYKLVSRARKLGFEVRGLPEDLSNPSHWNARGNIPHIHIDKYHIPVQDYIFLP
jgi:hypothetical protein